MTGLMLPCFPLFMRFFSSSHSPISEIQTFLHPCNCVFIAQCRSIASAASALSSYNDQIARGKTAPRLSTNLAPQRSLISTWTVGSFCSKWMLLPELVGFRSHWKIPRCFCQTNIFVPSSNVSLLSMWLCKWDLQTSGQFMPEKEKLLSVSHQISGRHSMWFTTWDYLDWKKKKLIDLVEDFSCSDYSGGILQLRIFALRCHCSATATG